MSHLYAEGWRCIQQIFEALLFRMACANVFDFRPAKSLLLRPDLPVFPQHHLNVALRNWTWHYLDLIIVLFGVIEQWMLPLYHVIYASIVGHASSATLRLWLKKPCLWHAFYIKKGSVDLCIYIYNIYVCRTFVDFFQTTAYIDIYCCMNARVYLHV